MSRKKWDIFQSKSIEESNNVKDFFDKFSSDKEELPFLLNFIKGLNYEYLGLIKEADFTLQKLFNNVESFSYWEIINKFRVMYYSVLPKRPKILSNVIGGRIGNALISNADVIFFLENESKLKLERIDTDIITYNFFENNFLDILSKLPPGWEPDYVFVFLPEVFSLPKGIEKSPYPVIGFAGDPWRINKLFHSMKFFDVIIPSMEHYCSVLKKLGESEVLYTSCAGIQGYFPPQKYISNSDIINEKEFDVIFTGCVSSPSYRKRSKYLWRLLKLGKRYKIFVGFFNNLEESYKTLVKSKITIHCPSIQGGVNLRVFESIANGVLLLHEEGDKSIEEFFEDKKEIVLFNENNFEELIEYYLNNDEEREKIVKQSILKNKKSCSVNVHMKNVIDKISRCKIDVKRRTTLKLSQDQILNSLGILDFYSKIYDRALILFNKAFEINGNKYEYINNLALTFMMLKILSNKEGKIKKFFELAIQMSNNKSVIPRFNLISYYRCIELDNEKFFELVDSLIYDLQYKPHELNKYYGTEIYLLENVKGISNNDIFNIWMEKILFSYPDRGSEYQEKFYQLILWRVLEYKADFYMETLQFDKAIESYKLALKYCNENEFILEKISRSFMKINQLNEAEFYLKKLLEISPLYEEAHLLLSEIEIQLGKTIELKERLEQLLFLNNLKHRHKFLTFLKNAN